jgi:hypothetical protein
MEKLTLLWSQLDIILAVIIFFAYLVIDGLYVFYTYSIVKHRPFSAATISFVMHFLLAVGVINYVENYLYVIPLAMGSWCGTYLVVVREKIKVGMPMID